tara:strand:+ start:12902 stop:13852 length:951 start_codon:yes stop_codon:yes gene_type:complete
LRIAVLGVGSIGSVLVGCLSDTDAEIVCVSRGVAAQCISSGIVLHSPEGSVEMIPGERYFLLDSEKGPIPEEIIGSCEVVILAGKASSTTALSSIAEDLLTSNGFAMSIQNGLGNYETIARRVGIKRAIGGSTTHSSWRDGEGSVYWTGRGSIELGKMDGSDPDSMHSEFIAILDEAGLSPVWSKDINRTIWRKLLINVAINPVCAIAGVRNGALLEVPELWTQSLEAMREAEAVARASGVNLGESDSEDYLRKVIEATSENRVSMLQDLMAGRKTEIDVLNGAIIAKGEELGLATPRNETLLALIKGIEMSQHLD